MDLQAIKTKSGKGIGDFQIPESLMANDAELVALILQSESMDDGERQYWFNLTQSMDGAQVEKLRGILTREKQKLAEIDEKYGKKVAVDPAEAREQAAKLAQMRREKQLELRAKEKEAEEQEKFDEEKILGELDAV